MKKTNEKKKPTGTAKVDEKGYLKPKQGRPKKRRGTSDGSMVGDGSC